MTTDPDSWHRMNQQYLLAALATVRARLERVASSAPEPTEAEARMLAEAEAEQALPSPAALQILCRLFGLSSFERATLLLCAGVELDARFAAACAAAQRTPTQPRPTLSLALTALAEPHWDALTPDAPLRHWRLIEIDGESLMTSPLRVDERVLHYLMGVACLDAQLTGLVEPLVPASVLAASHEAQAQRMLQVWSHDRSDWPLIQLCGADAQAREAIAAAACATLGLRLLGLQSAGIPAAPTQRDLLLRVLEREMVLSNSAVLLDCDDLEGERLRAVVACAERLQTAAILSGSEPLRIRRDGYVRLHVPEPSTSEQQHLWRSALGPLADRLNGELDTLISQFNLPTQDILAASAEVLGHSVERPDESPATLLWDACRSTARSRLEDLAQRIEPFATWDHLVLPDMQRAVLHTIVAHVRNRAQVYESWGFAAGGTRGLGISAMFAGASGTGKTMAAEVVARELRLDLYRIDLSAVVSKYIGETEKNLRRLFAAAEASGAILLFDEADALFGKRSEVKDSHDRYANIEVSYLLQRMESYRGLAILTTNLKQALDPAFTRRIRFIVQFPFPDAEQRAEIWRQIFPHATPTEGLEIARLAQLNVAGGSIRNIALNAAFLAAEAGEPVQMTHLLRATSSEYVKLEQPLTESEVLGWV